MKLRKFSNIYSIINIVFISILYMIVVFRILHFDFVLFICSIFFYIYIFLRLPFINLALIIILLFFNIRNFVKEKHKNIKSFVLYCILTLVFTGLDLAFIIAIEFLFTQ